jgi:RNA polymerase sigma-70 factor (ECF subfamily)
MTEVALSATGAPGPNLDALFAPLPEAAETATVRHHSKTTATGPRDDGAMCELVARIVDADQKALAALYDATVSQVYRLARNITRNLQCAEDVTEDVYWQVWRQAPRFDRRRGPVIAWLLTLSRSRALDHLRRRDEAVPHPETQTLAGETADSQNNPAARLSASESERSLNAALERLDPLPRQLLALAFYRGLSHDEIAQQTRLPLGSVKSHIRRALIALRGQLGPAGTVREASRP